MMLLFGTTITASFFDSLNPSAIAQQMLLQAMVKNKRHIWFFIIGIGSVSPVAFGRGAALWSGLPCGGNRHGHSDREKRGGF